MAPDSKTAARLGPALRALRKQNDWTLADVSSRTGLPVSTLSKVENDKLSLSYDKLVRLSEGLQVDIALLFAPGSAPAATGDAPQPFGRRSVHRAGGSNFMETKNYGHYYPAAELLQKKLVPIIAELRVRTLEEFGELIKHSGEEYAFVIDGACELHTELYAPLRLERGDSIYFDSTMGHAYLLAPDAENCTILSVCTSPEQQIREKFAPTAASPKPAAPKVTRAAKPTKKRAVRR